MKEKIEQKIGEWQQETERLSARRAQLAQAVTDCDVSIQRHLGAITGAQEILAQLAALQKTEQETGQETEQEGS